MIPGIIAGGIVASGGGSPLVYKTAESLSEVTTTSTSIYSTFASLTMTAAEQEANAKYLGIWSGQGSIDSTSGVRVELAKDGNALTTNVVRMKEISAPQDYLCVGGAFIHDATSTPADVTFTAGVMRAAASGTVAKAKNGRISMLKLGNDDFYAEPSNFTTTATTLQTAGTLSFTPATTGNYLVIVIFWAGHGGPCFFQVSDGTSSTTEMAPEVQASATSHIPVMAFLRLTGVSGTKNVTLKIRTSNGTYTAGVQGVKMVAIREDRFANIYRATLGSTNTGTGGPTSINAQTFTPAAGDHLTLCGALVSSGSTSISADFDYDDGGTLVFEAELEAQSTVAQWCSTLFGHRIAAYPASSRTQQILRTTEGANNASVFAESTILTLDLEGLT